ncbi:hypothetical protein D3C83_324620 [compost metagenome]
MERRQFRVIGHDSRHCARQRVVQSGEHLEHREVHVGHRFADEPLVAVRIVLQQAFEIAEKFR